MFQMRRDTRKWFSDIRSYYETDFDTYYLCLIAGLAAGHKPQSPITSDEVADLVDYFPGKFKSRGRLLLGMLLSKELKSKGINLTEREAVDREIAKYVDPDSPSRMSPLGVSAMNDYAHGGYDILCEYFPERPRTIEIFLRTYAQCIESYAGEAE